MKIKVHPSFVIYMIMITIFSSPISGAIIFSTLIVHEGFHYLAAKGLGEEIMELELTPFGGIMTYKQGKSPHKGIKGCLTAIAGPLGNYTMILLFVQPIMQKWLNPEIIRRIIMSNMSMMILNLFPALPLDGGRIIFCAGYYLFPLSALTSCLTAAGMGAGCLLLGIGLYGAIAWNCINISLLIVGGYLIVYARKSRSILLAENLYTLLQERQQNMDAPIPVKIFSVLPEMKLRDMIDCFGFAGKILFYVETSEEKYWITDKEIMEEYLQDADVRMKSLLKKTNIYKK